MSSTTLTKIARQLQRDYGFKYTLAVRLAEAALANLSSPWLNRFGFMVEDFLDAPHAGRVLLAVDLPGWFTEGFTALDFAIAVLEEMRLDVFTGATTPAMRQVAFARALQDATVDLYIDWAVAAGLEVTEESVAEPPAEALDAYRDWYRARTATALAVPAPNPSDSTGSPDAPGSGVGSDAVASYWVLDTFTVSGLLESVDWTVHGATDAASERALQVRDEWAERVGDLFRTLTPAHLADSATTATLGQHLRVQGPGPGAEYAFLAIRPAEGVAEPVTAEPALFTHDPERSIEGYLTRLLSGQPPASQSMFPFGLGVVSQSLHALPGAPVLHATTLPGPDTHYLAHRYTFTHPASAAVATLHAHLSGTGDLAGTAAALAALLCVAPDNLAGWGLAVHLITSQREAARDDAARWDATHAALRLIGEHTLALVELLTGIAEMDTEQVAESDAGLGFFLPQDSPDNRAVHDTLIWLAYAWIPDAQPDQSPEEAEGSTLGGAPTVENVYDLLHTLSMLGGAVPADLLSWVREQPFGLQ